MPPQPSSPEIPLPRGWPSCAKKAILHLISLAQFTLAYSRGWASNSPNALVQLGEPVSKFPSSCVTSSSSSKPFAPCWAM